METKTTYEILPEGQVKIIEAVVTTKERVVDFGAVQKRLVEIDTQIASLQTERADFQALVDAVGIKNEDAKVPDTISAVATAETTPQ